MSFLPHNRKKGQRPCAGNIHQVRSTGRSLHDRRLACYQNNLVEWVNSSFKTIFPKQDDLITSAVAYSEAVAFDQTKTNDNVTNIHTGIQIYKVTAVLAKEPGETW